MNDSNFQEGVGKKIVEALKQKDDDLDIMSKASDNQAFAPEPSIDFGSSAPDFGNDIYSTQSSVANDAFNAGFDANQFAYTDPEPFPEAPNSFSYQGSPAQFGTAPQNPAGASSSPHMPPNVAVLRRLITQLPNGVTKQTGAQIIRQTMEALGISMNSVLHEAQQVQDGLNDSVKTCMYSIQEYKNNIKTLEKQVLDYQKQIAYLNDLISLFVMTDKTR